MYKVGDIVWVDQSSHFSSGYDYKLPMRLTAINHPFEDDNDPANYFEWTSVEGFTGSGYGTGARIKGLVPDELAKAFREAEEVTTKFYSLLREVADKATSGRV